MPTTPAVTSLLARLARLRARIRGLSLLGGLGRLVLWAAVLLTASFLADWLLDLPIGVRRFVRLGLLDRPVELDFLPWVGAALVAGLAFLATWRRDLGVAGVFAFLLGGIAGVLAWVAARHLVRPLRRRLSDETLALSIEERHRRLNDRLAASLDFDRELGAPSRGESAQMMTRVVEEAETEARALSFAHVASARRALGHVGLGAAAAMVLALLLLAMPATAALWARRSLLLEEVRWPQQTTLVAVVRGEGGSERVADPAQPFVAALGQSLTIQARAQGKVPAEVEILDQPLTGGGRPLGHRMRAVRAQEGLFEHEFRDVRGDFHFFVRGGDDRDDGPLYTVVVRIPPKVTALRTELTFPPYLALPVRRFDGGAVTVPEGTRVAVSFESDVPLARAEAVVAEAPSALTRTGATYGFAFEATKSLRYRLRLVTEDGRENDAGLDTYEITVEPDTPAKPEWVWPRAPVEATPKGRVPLFAQTVDDHGVASLRLEAQLLGGETVSVPLEARTPESAAGANDRPYGSTSILSYVPLELSSLKDKDGKPAAAPARVQVRLVATDTKGQEGAGPWASVDVIQPDELERAFAGRRAAIKSELVGVRDDVKAVRDLAAGLGSAGTEAAGDAERQSLRDVQFRQGKAGGDADRAVRTLASLFNAFVYARMGAQVPNEHVLGLFDRRHRAAFSRAAAAAAGAPRGDGAGDGGESLDADADVYPWSLYREVGAARRERRLFDTGALDKLIAVLDTGVEVVDGLVPAAQAAAAEAARTGAAPEVRAYVAAADRLLAGIESALSAMAEWQNFAELTLFLRRLIEEQEALDGQIKGLKKGSSR